MKNTTHNALSLMSFGASMALFMVSMANAFDGAGWAVAMIGSMVYCIFWLLINSGGAE